MAEEVKDGQEVEKLPEGDVPSPIPGDGDPGDETKEGTDSAGA